MPSILLFGFSLSQIKIKTNYFWYARMPVKTIVKRKANEKVKKELLNSVRENDEAEETEIKQPKPDKSYRNN